MSRNAVGIYKCRAANSPTYVAGTVRPIPTLAGRSNTARAFGRGQRRNCSRATSNRRSAEPGVGDGISNESLKRLCEDFLRTKRANVRPASLELYAWTTARLLKHFGPDCAVKLRQGEDAALFMAAQETSAGRQDEAL